MSSSRDDGETLYVEQSVAQLSHKFNQTAISSPSRKIVLQSDDGEIFEVEQSVAELSQLIKLRIEENGAKIILPIPTVNGNILSKVIDYCRKHVKPDDDIDKDTLISFDREFIDVDEATLLDLASAAGFLDIRSLLDLSCQAIADKIKHKTVQEVREIFKIENDYIQEEEEEIRRQYAWAYD